MSKSDRAAVPTPRARPTNVSEPELLFEFYRPRDHKIFRCELRDLGKWGIAAQFFDGVDFVLSRRFESVTERGRIIPARSLAVEWATEERLAMEAYFNA
jgi:hypothetical protein